jgi:hypothetical protein
LVRTYNAGLSFALLFLLLFLLLLFLRTHYTEYCIIVKFHHAFSILHHCMQALPSSLARQFDQFRPDLMRALACSAVLQTTVAGHQTACARCCCLDRFKLVFSPISPCFYRQFIAFPQFKDVAMLSLVYELISTRERG